MPPITKRDKDTWQNGRTRNTEKRKVAKGTWRETRHADGVNTYSKVALASPFMQDKGYRDRMEASVFLERAKQPTLNSRWFYLLLLSKKKEGKRELIMWVFLFSPFYRASFASIPVNSLITLLWNSTRKLHKVPRWSLRKWRSEREKERRKEKKKQAHSDLIVKTQVGLCSKEGLTFS